MPFAIQNTFGQQSEKVELNEAGIYDEIHGEGELLVLLLWYMGSNKIYDRWLEDWSKKYQLIFPVFFADHATRRENVHQ